MAISAGQLRIQETTRDGVPVVVVAGDVDLATAPELCTRLGQLRGRRFVVDLSRVGFCDSTGLRALLGEAREGRIMSGRCVLVAPAEGQVRRLFELTGMATLLEVVEDVSAGVARLRR
jgi:anti-sigma B factor antagonist